MVCLSVQSNDKSQPEHVQMLSMWLCFSIHFSIKEWKLDGS